MKIMSAFFDLGWKVYF